MALIPRWNPCKNDLLACLTRSGDRFPSYRTGDSYRLARNLTQAWDDLELGLKRLVNGLLDESDPGDLVFSKSFSLWSFPAHYGYNLAHTSAQRLQDAALASRDAFLPLIAAVTLALCCLERRKRIEPNFAWRERLLKVHQLHPEWLGSLERSYATGKEIVRVGGFLDASTPEKRARVRGLVALYSMVNVSVCIYWGPVESVPTASLRSILDRQGYSGDINHQEAVKFALLVPSETCVDKLRRGVQQERAEWPLAVGTSLPTVSSQPPDSNLGEWPSVVRSSLPTVSPLPADPSLDEEDELVQKNSGQLPGETWKQFFERRDRRREGRQETAVQRQSRLSREKQAESKRCPGRKGASIWYWVERGEHRVRTLITRKQHEDYWCLYGKDQKRFDAWSNCWDICTEFGDRDEDQDDWLDIEDVAMAPPFDEDAQGGTPASGPTVEEPLPPPVPNAQEENDREDGELEQVAPESTRVDPLTESSLALGRLCAGMEDLLYNVEDLGLSMESVAYERYGFTGHPVDLGPISERHDWATARKLLGNGKWLDDSRHELFGEDSQSQGLRDELCRHLYLVQHTPADSYMRIPSLDFADEDNRLFEKKSWAFDVQKVNVDNQTRYMLSMKSSPPDSSDLLTLLLYDAAAVVHIVRVDMGETVPEIAKQLLQYGIRFNILHK
ncbi:hypothetical protein PQX77_016414 [Marasmius sp. AFHP31]|nr:hypothetical protein PQX77_016414 [Marasmius sp. AFHP31]